MGFLDGFTIGPVYGFMPPRPSINGSSNAITSNTINLGGSAMEAYCVKCKAKRQFTGEVHETNGRRMAKGICPTCGTKVTRILGKA